MTRNDPPHALGPTLFPNNRPDQREPPRRRRGTAIPHRHLLYRSCTPPAARGRESKIGRRHRATGGRRGRTAAQLLCGRGLPPRLSRRASRRLLPCAECALRGSPTRQCRCAPKKHLPKTHGRRAAATTHRRAIRRDAKGGTRSPHQNAYDKEFDPGIYVDITTGEPLFLSTDKFESGCGWPAFSKPIDPHLLDNLTDNSHGMHRTEVRSKLGGAHLGHVFNDGPKATGGLRYCINSASLRFVPKADMEREGYGALLPLLETPKAGQH